YLLVDEYQDTNACQYALLQLLVGPRAAFTAVGDDDQSIYGWRGATLENLSRLACDFPNLKVIKLEQNYRSSLNILNAANRLIANNPKLHDKALWSEHGPGDPVTVVPCSDDEAEAETVVARLLASRFERRGRFADYAILYRGNHQARIFEQALRKERIPYLLSGGQSFFDRAEIRDLLAYLRLLANDEDDPAFIRAVTTPRRGIGATSLAALGTHAGERRQSMFATLFEVGCEQRIAARQLDALREFGNFINRIAWRAQREPAATVLDALLAAIDYRGHLFATADDSTASARWQNVSDFVDWLKKRAEDDGATLLQLAQTVSLLSQIDRKDGDADAVRLSTVHAAKGLEFPHVFIVGCEEGLLPHHGEPARNRVDGDASEQLDGDEGSGEDDRTMVRIEEERRLMYVAVTRAQRNLTLSWCRERRRGRERHPQLPSRFLTEMQLDAAPKAGATVSADAARAKLAGLRALLAR
ncbi:MAG: 3'-5' exonuclease, partial [Burkholderiaceae bacterium]